MGKLSFSEIFSFNNLPQEAKEKHANKEIIYHGLFACSLEIVMIQLKFNKTILETNYFCRSEVTYDASKYFKNNAAWRNCIKISCGLTGTYTLTKFCDKLIVWYAEISNFKLLLDV